VASEATLAGAGTEAVQPRLPTDQVDINEWIMMVHREYNSLVADVAELMRKVTDICGSVRAYRGVSIYWDVDGPVVYRSTYRGERIGLHNIVEVHAVLQNLGFLADRYNAYRHEADWAEDEIRRIRDAVAKAEALGIPIPDTVWAKLEELRELVARARLQQERIKARVCHSNKPAEQIPDWFFEV